MAERRESVYLPSDRWDALLSPRIKPPNLRLVPYRGEVWLSVTTTGKLIPVGNRHLPRLGIWTFRVRGVQYRPETAKASDLKLGLVVRPVREPDNEHDHNAIAVVGTAGKVGYALPGWEGGGDAQGDRRAARRAIDSGRGQRTHVRRPW